MDRVFSNMPWVVKTTLPELADYKRSAAELIVEQYRGWEPPPGQYSFAIEGKSEFLDRLYDLFFFECSCHFEPFTVHQTNTRQSWAYVQNNERSTPVWHDHLLTATVNGVYYLSVPDPSGQLWFRHGDTLWKATPTEGELYLFPRWLQHKPMPQDSPEFRISVNIELITVECPIARDGRWRW